MVTEVDYGDPGTAGDRSAVMIGFSGLGHFAPPSGNRGRSARVSTLRKRPIGNDLGRSIDRYGPCSHLS